MKRERVFCVGTNKDGSLCGDRVKPSMLIVCDAQRCGPFCQRCFLRYATLTAAPVSPTPEPSQLSPFDSSARATAMRAAEGHREQARWIHDRLTPREKSQLDDILAQFYRIRSLHPDVHFGRPPESLREQVRALLLDFQRIRDAVVARDVEQNQTLEEVEPRLASPRSSLHPEFIDAACNYVHLRDEPEGQR